MAGIRKLHRTVLATVGAAALTVAVLPGAAFGAAASAGSGPAGGTAQGASAAARSAQPSVAGRQGQKAPDHNLKGPQTDRQAKLREEAVQKVLSGEAKAVRRGSSRSVKLGDGKYVEMGRETTDKIFTIITEFGDTVDPQYGGTKGPLHNQIKKPDRRNDNSTDWKADYSRKHFQDLYFSKKPGFDSLVNFYEKQSSGRYSVDGEVSDWVKIDYNEARYGSNKCGSTVCATSQDLVRDAANKWVADRKQAGDTDAQIKAKLAAYDKWDRYDHDGDGNFNEPDGYLDHFQIVHAGEDESAGGGVQGTDALWAHRWYVYGQDTGSSGPTGNKMGGTQVGNSGLWVGDYTMQPENGGLGVFAHEYGHDLGLPDLYASEGDNSTGFWTLMSVGSWLSDRKDDSIGDRPGALDAWSKLFLGWLNYDTAKSGKTSRHTLGYAEYNTRLKQALVVRQPDKTVQRSLTAPAAGTMQWYGGSADNLNNTLSRAVDLTGKQSAALKLKGWYQTEAGADYEVTEVSTDDGANWKALDGTVDGKPLPRIGEVPVLTGVSGKYTDLVYPLDAYAGKKIQLRFRYHSDTGTNLKGFAADEISVAADGTALFNDGAETADPAWQSKGFNRVGATYPETHPQYYIAENRQYVSYDTSLRGGPYNFGFGPARPDWVERYNYRSGLLIWSWDPSYADNDVVDHPGEGQLLPVDAHAKPMKWRDGTLVRERIQAFDSTFGRKGVPSLRLHKASSGTTWKSQKGNPVFDDHKGTYWYASNPTAGVKVRDTNTRITVLHESKKGDRMELLVSPSRK